MERLSFEFRLYMLRLLSSLRYKAKLSSTGGIILKSPSEEIKEAIILFSKRTNLWQTITSRDRDHLRAIILSKRLSKKAVKEIIGRYLAKADIREFLNYGNRIS